MSSDRSGTQPDPRGSAEERVDPLGAAIGRGDRTWSECGWGAGLEPRDMRDKDPAEGGRYRGRVADRARMRAPGGIRIQ
jgi:hypothetical protein